MKRLIAVLLSVAMVIGSFGIFAFAGGPEFDYQITEVRKLTGDNTFTELDGAAKPGDILVLTVALTNNSSDPFEFKGFSVFIGYDNSFVEPYNGMQPFKKNPFAQNTEDLINDLYWSPAGHSNVAEHYVSVAAGGADAYELAIGETLDCCYVAFKVKTGVESGTALFAMVEGKDNSITPSSGALADFAAKTVSISGIAPTLNEVAVDSISITVNGLTGATAALSAGSVMGTNVTSSVAWTVDPANQGVTVSADGTVTADAKATAGTYTFTATPDGTNVLGTAKSTTLTVNRTASTVSSVEVNGADTVAVPESTASPASATYTATVKDQYGDAMNPESVTWTVDPAYTGVSVSEGVVSITNETAAGSVTIKATSNTKNTVSGKKSITITKAQSTLKEFDATVSAFEVAVPASGSSANTITVCVAAGKDQFGADFTPSGTKYSLDKAYSGITINETTGIVSVSTDAINNEFTSNAFTVKAVATNGTVTDDITFTVKRDNSVTSSVSILKNNVALTTDTLIIPVSGSNSTTYTAKAFDQYGVEISGKSFGWTFIPGDGLENVTHNNGTVTVASDAVKDKTATLKAAVDNKEASITISVKNIDIAWPTITKKAGTYGDTWSEIVEFTGGSAMLNSVSVPGTFTLKNASGKPNAGETDYTIVFDATDDENYKGIENVYKDAVVATKNLTVKANDKTKVYGEEVPELTFTSEGLVEGDNLTGKLETTATQTSAVGTYDIIKGSLKASDNYELTFKEGTLTVTAKAITAADFKVDTTSRTYNKTQHFTTVTAITGLVLDRDYTVDYADNTDAGPATVTIAGKGNYTGSIAKNFTINPVTVTLNWAGFDGLVYDGNPKSVTATAGGILAGDECTVIVTGGTETNAGSYTATATELSNSNYKLPEIVTQGYTIAKATRTATASPAAITLNKDNNFTAELQFADLDEEAAPVAYVTPAAIAVVDGRTVTAVTTGSAIVTADIPETANYTTKSDITFNVTVEAADDKVSVVYCYEDGTRETVEYDPEDAATALPTASKSGYTFSGWSLDGSAVFKLEDITKAENAGKIFFASPVFQEVRYIPSTPKTNGTESVTVKGSTATVKSIDTGALETGKPVTLDFTQSKTEVKEVQFAAETVKAIAEASDEGVEIKLADAEVKLDAAAMESIAAALNGADMSLVVNVGSDVKKTMTSEQNKVIGAMKDTVVISASITSGGKNVSDFGGGSVDLTVDYKWNGKGVLRAAFIAADGTVEFVPVRFEDGKATITVKHFSDYVIYTEDALPFEDVADSLAYYYDPVKWAVENVITSGVDDTHFAPLGIASRAQMVTFLWKAAGCPEPTAAACGFTDVSADAYYYKAVLWAAEKGITSGTSVTTFSPDKNVTRAQVVSFLYRFSGSEAVTAENIFADVKKEAYYYDAVLWAIENGITSGTGVNKFSPDHDCLRGQIVTFLYNYFVKSPYKTY